MRRLALASLALPVLGVALVAGIVWTSGVHIAVSCSPAPCLSSHGLILVAGRDDEGNLVNSSGERIVRVEVLFRNEDGQPREIRDGDLSVVSPDGQVFRYLVRDFRTCGAFSPTTIEPGTTFGPRPVCFKLPPGAEVKRLALRWEATGPTRLIPVPQPGT